MKLISKCMYLLIACFLMALPYASTAAAINLAEQPKLQAVADQLIAAGEFTQAELDSIFVQAVFRPDILAAMQNPAEYKFTWGKYRSLFMQEERIQQGVEFWLEHQATLQRAEQQYGVPASMIIAIIGVESKFGRHKGKHKVLDSLVTLVTGYPRRSDFFARELKEFLILSKENQLDATEILGSYAGAVGFPQFIASSYRHYAVDFSGDGRIDLINQPVDAIGSVANYFVKNGWLREQPVSSPPLSSVPATIAQQANRKRKTQFSAASLRKLGAQIDEQVPDREQLNVLMLDASEQVTDPQRDNFYTVRAGDTACQIAERFSMSCRQLFKLNKLNEKGAIYRGQRLKLAAKTGKSSQWSVDTTKPQYFYTHENFYVITRYNQSVLYAMAVYDLSQAIAQKIAVQPAT